MRIEYHPALDRELQEVSRFSLCVTGDGVVSINCYRSPIGMFKTKFVTVSSIATTLVAVGAMTFFKESEYLILGILCCAFALLFGLGLLNDSFQSLLLKEGSSSARKKQLIASMIVAVLMGAIGLVAHFTVTVPGPPPVIPKFERSKGG